MNDIIEKENIIVENMIYEVRGIQVMLDRDLAKLYKCKNGTKEINQAVRNNIEKFPDRYSWVLTNEELNDLRSKFLTANISSKSRSLPRVFTEQGVAMLATIIKTKIAVEVSIRIMDAFVAMRHYISSNLLEQKYINNMVLKHDNEIKLLQESFDKMSEKVKNNHLFYDGQVYDAYSLMIDIFNLSKENITLVDNYIDKNILDILSKTNKNILIIINKYNEIDLNKYNKQYNNVKIKIKNKIHDRFIIIDNKILYHCGASFKDLGVKCFEISKIEDKEIIDKIINYINK